MFKMDIWADLMIIFLFGMIKCLSQIWPFLKATSFNSTGNETKLKRRKKVKFYVKRQRIWQNQAYMSPRDFLFEKEEKIAYEAEKRTMGVQNTD